jgi:hypothetical protein
MERKEIYIHNMGGEISWKTATYRIVKDMRR